MEKGIFIKDIRDGDQVDGIFLVREMNRAETRSGKPYLALSLMDNSGEIAARIWENADELQQHCAPGSFVLVSAQAQAFRDVLQLKINALRSVDRDGVDPALILPTTDKDVEKMFEELRSLVGTIDDMDFRQLLDAFLDDASFCARFKKAPAAKNMHHAYLGGLLEHTLAVCRLVNAVCPLYSALDRDLLLAGAVLHDAGKIEEFSYETLPFNYSDRGRLEGHMVLCIQMIQEKIRLLPSFPEERATLLKHLVLSHHGRHEFGAPTLPMTLEAFVLNLIDDLDAKINFIGRLSNHFPDDNYQWTDYQRTLERFLFIRRTEDDVLRKETLGESTSPRSIADQKTEASSSKKEAPSSIQFSLFER